MAWAVFPAIPPAPPVSRAIGQRTGLRPVWADVGIRPYMHALPFSIVGAHFICARAAPPVRRRLARKRSCPAGGHKGRPYAVVLTWGVGRGATPRQTRPPGPPWPPVVAARPWRHVGMPPYEVQRGRGGNRGHLHARTALFHCRGALYMRPCRRLAGNCSRPGCTNGGLIQFIHSSFKECFLFCYWSFKIFQGFSGMIMPSGGHKQAPLSIIDASFLFLLFFFFLFSLFSFSLKHRPHGACRAVCVLSGAQSAPRNSSVTPV